MNIENDTEFYKANLVLRVSAISTDPDPANYPLINENGNIQAGRIGYTWFSLDMRSILGDLYDKFQFFNLKLCSIQYDEGIGTYASTTLDYNIYFQMSGPAFYTSTYNVATRRKTSEATIGLATIVRAIPGSITYDDAFLTTFEKQPTLNFTINLLKGFNDSQVLTPAGTLFPLMNFYFNIIPVEYAISDKYPQVY